MPQYALARHVFVCLHGGHVVFLDVHSDRYFALEADKTAGLSAVVRGWPVQTIASGPDGATTSSVLHLLLERRLVHDDGPEGRAATPVKINSPADELAANDDDHAGSVGLLAFVRFVKAAIVASTLLKFRPFEHAVPRVQKRNQRRQPRAKPLDVVRVQRLVATFAKCRPFFFTSKDACLFEAFALSEFLASYGIYPNWVFGVHARPFAAHCWLQQDGLVFNDTVEHVSRYVPIMVV